MMVDLNTTSLTPRTLAQDVTTHNQTDVSTCYPFRALPVIFYSITLLICIFGLMGNSIVLWFVRFYIKKNTFTTYILNLAFTDACFLLFSIILIITSVVARSFCWVKELSIRIVFVFLWWLMYNNSFYLLTTISTERCLSVLYPIWYRCHRPRYLSIIVCAVLWVLSIQLSGTMAFLCVNSMGNCKMVFLYMSILNVAVLFPIMVLSNLTLFIKVRCSSQQHQPGKLYAVILLTVLFFLLFAVPMSFKTFLSYPYMRKYINPIFYMLATVNSSVNPFIYFLVGSYRKRRFRGSLKGALQSIFEEEKNAREDGGPTPIDLVETATKIPSPASQPDPDLERGSSLGPRIKELSDETTLQVTC